MQAVVMSGRQWPAALAISAILHGAALGFVLMQGTGRSPESAMPVAIAVDLVVEHPPDAVAMVVPPNPVVVPDTLPNAVPVADPASQSATISPVIPKKTRSRARPVASCNERPRVAPSVEPVALQLAAVSNAEVEAPHPAAEASAPVAPTIGPVAAPVATTASPRAEAPSMPGPDYLRAIVDRLERYKIYPEDARSRREQGTVLVAFSIDRSGRILSFDVRKSSGSASLDRAAQDMIYRADPLPPIPTSYAAAQLSLALPVTFALR